MKDVQNVVCTVPAHAWLSTQQSTINWMMWHYWEKSSTEINCDDIITIDCMNMIIIQVKECDVCQRVMVKSTPELHPVPVHSTWHHIGIDFVGRISSTSRSGNKYFLTVSDYFSKWVCAFPLPTKEATGVACTLFKVLECSYYWSLICMPHA